MHITKFGDDKSTPKNMPGLEIDGAIVRGCVGMIYWYRWGDHIFDIRVMRELVGLPRENDELDLVYFMDKKSRLTHQECLTRAMKELLDAAKGKAFYQLMKEHDDCLWREIT